MGAGGNTVAATWGRHAGQGAGIGGINTATASPLAGPARGVEGVVNAPANGSHAVFGATNGAGHSIAGDTPADAKGVNGVGPNTTAATWGRHGGVGAGIGGVSAMGYGGEFIGGKSHLRLIQTQDAAKSGPPGGDGHLLGELYADGAGNLWFNQADGQLGCGKTPAAAGPGRRAAARVATEPVVVLGCRNGRAGLARTGKPGSSERGTS
jgi:hypothetical protein